MSAPDRARATPGRARAILPAPAGRTSGGFLVNDLLFRGDDLTVTHVTSSRELSAELASLGAHEIAIVDSLFLFDEREAAALERAARRSPLVLLAHSLPSLIPGHEPAGRLRRLAGERAFLTACAGAVAPSAFMAGALVRRGLGAHAITVIPPPPICDGRADGVRSPTAPAGSASGIRPDGNAPRLLTVANWTRSKALSHVARALASLADLGWHWTVIGDRRADEGYSRRVLSDLARAGLEERVELVAPVPSTALGGYYRAADLFVLPSLMESYGLVYAEAISHGLPVVAYRCAAVPEVVGTAGVLVPAGRADMLAHAIRDLLSGGLRRDASTGNPARERVSVADIRARCASRAHSLPRWTTARSRLSAAIDRTGATAAHTAASCLEAEETAR